MSNYSLDIAFSSDNTPLDDTTYIVTSFGYVNDTLGEGQGQIVEKLPQGADFEFAIFDTAARACTITEVQIIFTSEETPFLDGNNKAVTSPITINSGFDGAAGDSIGCNVTDAMRWLVASYSIADVPNLTKYDFEIVVYATDASGTEKTFGVDPEMIIDGSGTDVDAASYA